MTILPWQQQSWAHLCDYRAQNRVPQALLISGNKGLGKQQLAKQFAFSLLCDAPQNNGLHCGHCDRCLLLNAQTHPDFLQITPDEPGKAITIGQIRGLVTRLTLKPQFDSWRVVIVSPADLMNNAAANAFLKCLEEPTERTVIILISDKPACLPATIVSRCQKLVVVKPDKEAVFAWLKEQNVAIVHSDVISLYGLAQGSPLLALAYSNDGTLTLRNDCFKAWIDIAKQRRHPVVIAEEWHKLPNSSLLFWITSWIIDMIKCCYPINADWLYNPDLKESLQELSLQIELKELYKLYDLILASRQRLNTQINKQTMFEEILIKWLELNLVK
ncbi:DNA polymerase III subunit delta' [Methylobacter sp. S3L5C]|uniref:DNA polymerase III subunit delta' n=1 Tax=Methylobacter sp. S3L5C TaxID=2839024 RepID=UPI001FAD29D6|nr:DNA polymerase III subunit delta' [Methylobacter sp. S3L5C]UOA09996.1 DNA polymerase III subunit delta' [Methylobacter sp. S3L5C]